MNRLLILSANDFRVVFRDPMLRIFLFLPLLIIAIVVWVLPIIFSAYPAVRAYDYVLLMWAGMQTATMFGFINGFVFLEEKDEQVFAALRVMPVAATTLISVRMVLGVSITFAINVMIFSLNGWLPIRGIPLVLIALQYALLAPVLTLALATFAQNKVEGLAHFKVYNFAAMLPVLIYFLPYRALHGLAVLPTYWTFRSVEAIHQGGSFFFLAGGGLLGYLAVLGVLIRLFERRVF